MRKDIAAEIKALHKMTTGELAEQYGELHGQPVRTRHRAIPRRGRFGDFARRRPADMIDPIEGR
jgi:hypothetical protein